MAVAVKRPTFSERKKLVKPHVVLQQVSFYLKEKQLQRPKYSFSIFWFAAFLGNIVQSAVRNQESCLLPIAKGPCFGFMKRYAFNKVWLHWFSRHCSRASEEQIVWSSRRRTGVNCSLMEAAKVTATISQVQINVSRLVAVHCPVWVSWLLTNIFYELLIIFISQFSCWMRTSDVPHF